MTALSTTGSTLGMVFGTAGLVLGIMNYLRDLPQVKVSVQWNMKDPKTQKVIGLVRVTNTGRRPVFISIAALELPNGPFLVLYDSLQGTKLAEGDGPVVYTIDHETMPDYTVDWRKIRAYVELSSGKKYRSRFPASGEKPPRWIKP